MPALSKRRRDARATTAPIVARMRSRTAESRNRLANQPSAIRAKIRFWRAAMRREVSARENFFIAKICDSESAQSAHRGAR
jgi:hypothetical protein